MSYEASECRCDWCSGNIHNGDVACKRCYEELEEANKKHLDKIAELEARINELEAQ